MNPWYKDYGEYLAERFPGGKVQKISVNGGLSCPNRDGTLGRGGCIYCDNSGFTPSYCMVEGSVAKQLMEGKRFFARKYPDMRYLAYFQSFTGTYSNSIHILEKLYSEALGTNGVIGLIIGTRPDCLQDEVLDLLGHINMQIPVIVELGAETCHDETLMLVNRNHTWDDVCGSVERLHEVGIETGLHLIAGLPGEGEIEILENVRSACALSISSIKLHHLQILRGTELHRRMIRGDISVEIFEDVERYIDLCIKIIENVPSTITIERFVASAPSEMVVAPRWGLKNHEFTNILHNRLREKYPAGLRN